MINKNYILSFFIIVLALIYNIYPDRVVYADEEQKSLLTLEQSVKEALLNNAYIAAASEQQKAAANENRSALADLFPKAMASYTYTRFRDKPFAIFNAQNLPMADRDDITWDVTLIQPITGYLYLITKKKVASLNLDMKKIEKEETVLEIIKQVKTAYYNILLSKRYLYVLREAVEQLGAHVMDAEQFYDQGMIALNDLLKSKVALAEVSQDKIKAQNQVRMAKSFFNITLKRDINAIADIEDIKNIEPVFIDLTESLTMAVMNRPELKILRIHMRQAGLASRLVYFANIPQVLLFGQYNRHGENYKATRNEHGNTHNAILGVKAEWTFFEWGKSFADAAVYKHKKLALASQIKGIEDSIRLEVKQAYLDLEVSEKNIVTAENSLSQAKENYRITNLQYQQSTTTSTEVLGARTFLTQAELNYYGALYGYMISLAELERATGKR